MPSIALVATLLQGASSPEYGLFVAGSNLTLAPGSGGNRLGVPLDTIKVTEAGFGGVSSMAFIVEDPLSVFTISEGDEVVYQPPDDVPDFRGWVQRWNINVLGIGRSFTVECIGVEALLDWFIIPSLTITAGTYQPVSLGGIGGSGGLVQQIVAAAIGPPVPVNVTGTTGTTGTQANPVGAMGAAFILDQDIVLAGETLREALRQLADYRAPEGQTSYWHMFTVDFWLGLRWFLLNGDFPNRIPTDYDDLTVDTAGPIRPEAHDYERDAGSVVRMVYVKGGNAAGTGPVYDGSGKVGASAVLEDTTILTAAARDAAGLAYLRDKSYSIRGDTQRQTFVPIDTPADHVQALSNIVITDPQIGVTAETHRIQEIQKTYQGGGQETWSISYGGMPASFERQVRRLTRDQKA